MWKSMSYIELTTWNQEVLAHPERTTSNWINDMFDFPKKGHRCGYVTVKISANAERHTSACNEDQCWRKHIFGDRGQFLIVIYEAWPGWETTSSKGDES